MIGSKVGSANAKADDERVEGPRIKDPSVVKPLWERVLFVFPETPVAVIVSSVRTRSVCADASPPVPVVEPVELVPDWADLDA